MVFSLSYSGVGVALFFFTEIVYLCYVEAVCRVSMLYHAWNWLKSLWCGGGGVVWWCGGGLSLF